MNLIDFYRNATELANIPDSQWQPMDTAPQDGSLILIHRIGPWLDGYASRPWLGGYTLGPANGTAAVSYTRWTGDRVSRFEPGYLGYCGPGWEDVAGRCVNFDEPGRITGWRRLTPREHAARNVRRFLADASRVRTLPDRTDVTERPDLDEAHRFAYGVVTKPGNQITVLMPALPLEQVRVYRGGAWRPPLFEGLGWEERKLRRVVVRHAYNGGPPRTVEAHWEDAARHVADLADYQTQAEAIATLFARM